MADDCSDILRRAGIVVHPCRPSFACTAVVHPNGLLLQQNAIALNASWTAQLHAALPRARRLSLWSEDGRELLWTKKDGTCGLLSEHCKKKSCATLHLVADDHPFMWPATADGGSSSKRRVHHDGGSAAGLGPVRLASRHP